jgi:hypothetical protein
MDIFDCSTASTAERDIGRTIIFIDLKRELLLALVLMMNGVNILLALLSGKHLRWLPSRF